jgi:ATP-dependent DNA helicase RecQ
MEARSNRDYGTLDDARAVLQRYFGYPDFRPAQLPAVEAVVSGRDALLLLPTGGGKSICYQVPALARQGLTVVVSPLISLMQDQVEALRKRGIHSAFINSTLSASEAATHLADADRGTLRMLYLAPERLDSPKMLQRLRHIGVALLAVDEAHCISEWGHDFRPSYRRLGVIRKDIGSPQTVALTATATLEVRQDIVQQLCLDNPNVIVAGFDRTNLVYHVIATRSQEEKDKTAIELLRNAEGTAVVYAPTRKAVERVAAALVRGRVRAVAYHAGLEAGERQRAQDAFMNEQARVIVATSAFGMGIDKPNVRLVVHHAMSGSLEAYYQEAGRAGRDGNTSTCVLLHTVDDRLTHEFFIEGAHPDRTTVERTWRALRESVDNDMLSSRTINDLATLLPTSIGERRIGAAIRVLIAAGAIVVESPARSRFWMRMLATPDRVARELTGERQHELELLQAVRRICRADIETGTTIELDRLPQAFRKQNVVVPLLTRLEATQFVMWNWPGGGFRLDARSRQPDWLPIDWTALARRRQRELARLDAMQKYALTRACRRAFVLRYFGDPDAKPHCGACDRCLGTTANRPIRALMRNSMMLPARRHS